VPLIRSPHFGVRLAVSSAVSWHFGVLSVSTQQFREVTLRENPSRKFEVSDERTDIIVGLIQRFDAMPAATHSEMHKPPSRNRHCNVSDVAVLTI
jgi:hypothetical protein